MSFLTDWLRDKFTFGPRLTPEQAFTQRIMEEKRRGQERLRAGHGGIGGKLWFLPYADSRTGETERMRAEYRLMLRDPTVKQALLSKVFGVGILDASVQPADETRPGDKDAADFVTHALKRVYGGILGATEAIVLPGLIDGYSLAEKVWCVEDREGRHKNKIIGQALKSKDPQTYRLIGDEYNNVTGIRGMLYNSGETYPVEDFVLWRHTPLYSSPYGTSDLRAAYRAFWMIDTSWKLRMIHLEKWSTPYIVGKYKELGDKAGLEAELEVAKGQSFITIPDTAAVEALSLAVSGTADYQSAIQDLQHEIMLGITGAFLQAMEGVNTGARSIGEVHASTAELLIWYLAQSLCNCLNEQWVPDLIRYNFAPGTGLPTITLGGINDADMVASTQVDEALQRMGLPLSKKELYKKYSRTEPTDEADMLAPPLPTMPPGPGFTEAEPAVVPAKPQYMEHATKLIMERLTGSNGYVNGAA